MLAAGHRKGTRKGVNCRMRLPYSVQLGGLRRVSATNDQNLRMLNKELVVTVDLNADRRWNFARAKTFIACLVDT